MICVGIDVAKDKHDCFILSFGVQKQHPLCEAGAVCVDSFTCIASIGACSHPQWAAPWQ